MLPSFAFTALTGVVAIAFVASGRPMYNWIQEDYVPEVIQVMRPRDGAKDPELGIIGLLPSSLDNESSRKCIVVAITDCSPCNRNRIQYGVDTAASFKIPVRMIVADDLNEQRASMIENEWKSVTVISWEKVDARAWNIYFLPRVYAIDEAGAVAYVQSVNKSYDDGVREAIATIREK